MCFVKNCLDTHALDKFLNSRTKLLARQFYSSSFINNFLLIIPLLTMSRIGIPDKSTDSIFSKTKPQIKNFYSIFLLFFHKESSPARRWHIVRPHRTVYKFDEHSTKIYSFQSLYYISIYIDWMTHKFESNVIQSFRNHL